MASILTRGIRKKGCVKTYAEPKCLQDKSDCHHSLGTDSPSETRPVCTLISDFNVHKDKIIKLLFSYSSYKNVLYHHLVTVLSISCTMNLLCYDNVLNFHGKLCRKRNSANFDVVESGDQCSPVSEWPNETQGADLAPYLLSLQTPFM